MWILLLEIVQFLKSLLGQFLLSNLAENLGQCIVFGFAKSRNLPRSGTGLDPIAIVDIVVLLIQIQIYFDLISEPKMEELSDGAQLLRALNVLTVKIIDRSDHTNITSAIIKLLSDAVANASLNAKFAETVMKCMWKIIRLLPNWMDDETRPLNVDLILSDLHDFLKTYPPSYWKKQESNTPLRTVKTVLHAMVKARGNS